MRLVVAICAMMIWVFSQAAMSYVHASSITSEHQDFGRSGGAHSSTQLNEFAIHAVDGSHHENQHEPRNDHEQSHQMAACCGSTCSLADAVLAGLSRPNLPSLVPFDNLATLPAAASIDLTKPPPEPSV